MNTIFFLVVIAVANSIRGEQFNDLNQIEAARTFGDGPDFSNHLLQLLNVGADAACLLFQNEMNSKFEKKYTNLNFQLFGQNNTLFCPIFNTT